MNDGAELALFGEFNPVAQAVRSLPSRPACAGNGPHSSCSPYSSVLRSLIAVTPSRITSSVYSTSCIAEGESAGQEQQKRQQQGRAQVGGGAQQSRRGGQGTGSCYTGMPQGLSNKMPTHPPDCRSMPTSTASTKARKVKR